MLAHAVVVGAKALGERRVVICSRHDRRGLRAGESDREQQPDGRQKHGATHDTLRAGQSNDAAPARADTTGNATHERDHCAPRNIGIDRGHAGACFMHRAIAYATDAADRNGCIGRDHPAAGGVQYG